MIEWALRKKGLSKVIIRAVMSLYDGAKTRVRVGSSRICAVATIVCNSC